MALIYLSILLLIGPSVRATVSEDKLTGKRTREMAFSTKSPASPSEEMIRVVEALVADPYVLPTEIESENAVEVEKLIHRYRPYVVIQKWFFDHLHTAGGVPPHSADIFATFNRVQKSSFHPETADDIASSWVRLCVRPLVEGRQSVCHINAAGTLILLSHEQRKKFASEFLGRAVNIPEKSVALSSTPVEFPTDPQSTREYHEAAIYVLNHLDEDNDSVLVALKRQRPDSFFTIRHVERLVKNMNVFFQAPTWYHNELERSLDLPQLEGSVAQIAATRRYFLELNGDVEIHVLLEVGKAWLRYCVKGMIGWRVLRRGSPPVRPSLSGDVMFTNDMYRSHMKNKLIAVHSNNLNRNS